MIGSSCLLHNKYLIAMHECMNHSIYDPEFLYDLPEFQGSQDYELDLLPSVPRVTQCFTGSAKSELVSVSCLRKYFR